VPTAAIQTGQQGPYVYIVDAEKKAQRRAVLPGFQTDDLTIVRQGVSAGAVVVVDGQSRVNPGSQVAIVTTGTDTGTARLHGMTTGIGGEVVPTTPGGAGRGGARGGGNGASGATTTSGVSAPRPVSPAPAMNATPPALGTPPATGTSPTPGTGASSTSPAAARGRPPGTTTTTPPPTPTGRG